MPEIKDITGYSPPRPLFHKEYHTCIPNRALWLYSCIPDGRGGVNFFTDGSEFSYGIGCGVFSNVLNLSIARRFPEHISVHHAEILVIIEVAQWLRYIVPTTVKINIL